MHVLCPNCQEAISYIDKPPKFCSECGCSFGGATEIVNKTSADTDATGQSQPPAAQETEDAKSDNSEQQVAERKKLLAEFLEPAVGNLGQLGDQSTLNQDVRQAATIIPQEPPKPILPKVQSQQTFGNYRFERQLGRGGMGVVWEATELDSGRKVAIKLLSKTMIRDEPTVDRFIREGRLAAQLSHPRSTFIYKAGELDGQPYIAMELMPGDTLQETVDKDGKLPFNLAVDKILDVIDGLIAAHRLGIIHRDVKPSNCFVDHDGRIKVGDFGLSKALISDVSLTQTGTFMGTPLYAAPEQIRGAKVDERTDLYSVAATLFTLIAGRPAYSGDALSVTAQIISDEPPAIREYAPETPKAIETIIARGLAKNPDDRFEDLETLRMALEPFATGASSLAGLGRRLAAFMLDVTMIALILQFIFGGLGAWLGISSQLNQKPEMVQNSITLLQLISTVTGTFVVVLYFFILEGRYGRSLGKKLMGLKVTDSHSEKVGYTRALIRAIFIPGGLGLSILWAIWRFVDTPFGIDFSSTEISVGLLNGLIESSLKYLPFLVCFLTMRSSNGFRGIHEFLSGTRTLLAERRDSDARKRDIPSVKFAPAELKPIEGYTLNGLIGKTTDGAVVQHAHDKVLNRNVWIFVGEKDLKLERINLARNGRLRWLHKGEVDGEKWDAFESVDGIPLVKFAENAGTLPWSQSRFLLLDLARELSVACEDGSLPKKLSPKQIWVDENGQAKLLDSELFAPNSNQAENPEPKDSNSTKPENNRTRANRFFSNVFEMCVGDQILPASATQMREQMATDSVELDSVVNQLEVLTKKPATLRWDDRLGVLAITLSLEFAICTIITTLFFVVLVGLFQIPFVNRQWAVMPFALLLPAVVGYFWRNGGPVFDLMRIQVLRKDGSSASRTRRMFRNVFAWFPIIVNLALGLSWIQLGPMEYERAARQRDRLAAEKLEKQKKQNEEADQKADQKADPKADPKTDQKTEKESNEKTNEETADDRAKPSQSELKKSTEPVDKSTEEEDRFQDFTPEQKEVMMSIQNNRVFVLISVLFSCFMTFFYVLGPVFSILNPGRGLQDFLAGTRLVIE